MMTFHTATNTGFGRRLPLNTGININCYPTSEAKSPEEIVVRDFFNKVPPTIVLAFRSMNHC